MNQNFILQTQDLSVWFPIFTGVLSGLRPRYIRAVNGVSLSVQRGETLGIVGESGCGKTTLGRTIMKLQPPTSGRIIFDGTDITDYGFREMKPIRRNLQMIFQDPYASLDPRMRVGECIGEPLALQQPALTRDERRTAVLKLMEQCGLPEKDYEKFPHEFSGGQRQRIGIARALVLHPKLLLCDEPVSALDVSIQAQLINLMMKLQREYELTMLFISHDLSVISHVADRVAVMYLGQIVELATRDEIFRRPLHPYTKALLAAVPVIGRRGGAMPLLDGEAPGLTDSPDACPLYNRCAYRKSCCREAPPQLRETEPGHLCCCHMV